MLREFTPHDPLEVVFDGGNNAFLATPCAATHVGREEYVVQLKKPVVHRERFIDKDVEACAGYGSCLKRLYQCSFVYQPPSGGIHQKCRFLHASQRRLCRCFP